MSGIFAGCACVMTSSIGEANLPLVCTGSSKCGNGNQVAYRRSQPVGVGKIEDDPPNFILNKR
jgi:hypothetical protein